MRVFITILIAGLLTCLPLSSQSKYEIRAAWLTTIGALDFPMQKANSPQGVIRQKRELCRILDKLKDARFNTVLLQTRLRGDVIYPSVFEEAGASFVTLKIDGELRGCMGSAIAHRPFILDLIENSHSAAFKDPRFEPLSIDELDFLKISVSILSVPYKIVFSNESELLKNLTPFVDGLIIRDGEYQAVYLPAVWEYFGDNKKEFLKSLKLKAGMSEDYFSDTMQAFKFKTVEISQ